MRFFPKKSCSLIVTFVFTALLCSCSTTTKWKQPLEMAQKYQQAGDSKNAIKYYYSSLEEMEKARADKLAQIAVLGKLIALEKKENNHVSVEKLCDKVIPMAELAYGPDSLNLIPFLAEMRDAVSRHADRDKAGALLDRIISIQEKNSGPDSVQLMWFLEDYAKSTSPTCGDRFDLGKLRHLVALRAKHFGATNKDTIRDKLILADVLSQKAESEKEAEQLYRECIKATQLTGEKSLQANSSLRYSRFLRRSKRLEDALPFLEEAYSISGPGKTYSPLFGPEIADLLGEALETKGKRKEAKELYETMIAHLNKQAGTHPLLSDFSDRLSNLDKN